MLELIPGSEYNRVKSWGVILVKMMMMMMMTTINVANTHECYSTGARDYFKHTVYMISLNPKSPLKQVVFLIICIL